MKSVNTLAVIGTLSVALLSGCEQAPKPVKTAPMTLEHTPSTASASPQAIAFLASSCLKFAMHVDAGSGTQLKDRAGKANSYLSNAGIVSTNGQPEASTIELKHLDAGGTEEKRYMYDQGGDNTFPDGQGVHLESHLNPDQSIDASGWICDPTKST